MTTLKAKIATAALIIILIISCVHNKQICYYPLPDNKVEITGLKVYHLGEKAIKAFAKPGKPTKRSSSFQISSSSKDFTSIYIKTAEELVAYYKTIPLEAKSEGLILMLAEKSMYNPSERLESIKLIELCQINNIKVFVLEGKTTSPKKYMLAKVI